MNKYKLNEIIHKKLILLETLINECITLQKNQMSETEDIIDKVLGANIGTPKTLSEKASKLHYTLIDLEFVRGKLSNYKETTQMNKKTLNYLNDLYKKYKNEIK